MTCVRFGHRRARPLLPDREKHGALRGSMTVSPSTPSTAARHAGHAAALAFGLASPTGTHADEEAARRHRRAHLAPDRAAEATAAKCGCAPRWPKSRQRRPGRWGAHRGGRDPDRPGRRLRGRARLDAQRLIDPRGARRHPRAVSRIDHRGSYLQMHFALDRLPSSPHRMRRSTTQHAGVYRPLHHTGGGQRQWEDAAAGSCPPTRGRLAVPSQNDPDWRPRESTPRRRSRCGSRSRARWTTASEGRNGSAVIDKSPARAEFRAPHHPAHDVHAQAHGRDVRRPGRQLLPRAAPSGPDRPQPARDRKACRAADPGRRAYLAQRRMPRRARDHVHPGLQRGAGGRCRPEGVGMLVARGAMLPRG